MIHDDNNDDCSNHVTSGRWNQKYLERTRHDNDDESLQRAIRESSDIAKNASQLKSESELEDEFTIRAMIRESAEIRSANQFVYSNTTTTTLIDLCDSHDEDEDDAKPLAIRGTDSNITEVGRTPSKI
eukprot:scaffold43851_cov40-Cyclotella_meneghiniana.AAC.2